MKITQIALLSSVLLAASASAATISFDFSSPAGDLNASSHTYNSTPAGYSVTAYGFVNGVANDLYGKNAGGNESGLGLDDQSDSEIGTNGAIVLDISQIQSFATLQIKIGSVQSGEGYIIYGSNSLLSFTQLAAGNTDNQFFNLSGYSNDKYLTITASSGNVLLEGLSGTTGRGVQSTPEPASIGLLGAGLSALGLLRRKSA